MYRSVSELVGHSNAPPSSDRPAATAPAATAPARPIPCPERGRGVRAGGLRTVMTVGDEEAPPRCGSRCRVRLGGARRLEPLNASWRTLGRLEAPERLSDASASTGSTKRQSPTACRVRCWLCWRDRGQIGCKRSMSAWTREVVRERQVGTRWHHPFSCGPYGSSSASGDWTPRTW